MGMSPSLYLSFFFSFFPSSSFSFSPSLLILVKGSTVEGIWQGLQVYDTEDTDAEYMIATSARSLVRKVKGKLKGWRKGIASSSSFSHSFFLLFSFPLPSLLPSPSLSLPLPPSPSPPSPPSPLSPPSLLSLPPSLPASLPPSSLYLFSCSGLHGKALLSLAEARKQILMMTYKYVLEHVLQKEVAQIQQKRMKEDKKIVIVCEGGEVGGEVEEEGVPFGAAGMLKLYLMGAL